MNVPVSPGGGRALFRQTPLQFTAARQTLPVLVPQCPHCGCIDLRVTARIPVSLATEGLEHAGAYAIALQCTQCEAEACAVSYYCASIPDPAGAGHCQSEVLEQIADERHQFQAEATSSEVWTINRRIYRSGRRRQGREPLLLRGPFVIDQHLFPAMRRLSAIAGVRSLLERLAVPAAAFLRDYTDTPNFTRDILK